MRGHIPKKNFCAAALAAALLAAGCAPALQGSGSSALAKIARSERAIDAARQDCRQNPTELNRAERKLGRARSAYAAREFQAAEWLAEEAQADASFARTQAALEQAEQYLESLQKSNASLKAGLGGASGGQGGNP